MTLIRKLQENPNDTSVRAALKDPSVAHKFNKLVEAGVL